MRAARIWCRPAQLHAYVVITQTLMAAAANTGAWGRRRGPAVPWETAFVSAMTGMSVFTAETENPTSNKSMCFRLTPGGGGGSISHHLPVT